MFSWANKE
jgi:ribosome production factor 1